MYMSEASLNKMKAPKQNLDSNELTRNDTVDLIDRFRRRRQCTADATTATNSDHVPYASRHHVPASGYATPKLLLLPATMTTLCVSNSSLEGPHLKGSGASPDCSSVSSFSVLLQKCKKSRNVRGKAATVVQRTSAFVSPVDSNPTCKRKWIEISITEHIYILSDMGINEIMASD